MQIAIILCVYSASASCSSKTATNDSVQPYCKHVTVTMSLHHATIGNFRGKIYTFYNIHRTSFLNRIK